MLTETLYLTKTYSVVIGLGSRVEVNCLLDIIVTLIMSG